MKKIVLTSILLLIALSIHAQEGIPRGGQARSDLKSVSFTNVSKTITIHKKEIQKKEIKKYDARVGFQQFVEVAPDYGIFKYHHHDFNHFGLHLIDGYRFNNKWFVGLGIGLDYYPDAIENDVKDALHRGWGMERFYNINPLNKISIPIYIHSKRYFFHSDYSPYLSYSLGQRLSAQKDVSWMHHVSLGCEYQSKEDLRLYASIGLELSKYLRINSEYKYYGRDCTIFGHSDNNYNHHFHYYTDQNKYVDSFLSFRLGVTFSQDKISLMRLTRDGISLLKRK